MRPGDAEPNEHYRPWLEANIGQQGVDWDWEILSVVESTIRIIFSKEEDLLLFELKWP